MSKFDPDAFENDTPQEQMMPSIGWSDLPAQTKTMLLLLTLLKILAVFAWSASFSQINPMASGVFISDMLPFPLPQALEDLSVGSILNVTLGILAVAMPAVIWHFVLCHHILSDIRGYFEGQPQRIVIGAVLVLTYALTITLEVLSLLARVKDSLGSTSPIPTLGDQPELIPLLLVSLSLILGSCLLGLASAALSLSIKNRFENPSH
jgi:hypothetical protein